MLGFKDRYLGLSPFGLKALLMKNCCRKPLQRISSHRNEDSSGNGSIPTTDISSSLSHYC